MNECNIKIDGTEIGGKFSNDDDTTDIVYDITKKSRIFILTPNMDYQIDGVDGVRFLYNRETWDKLCDAGAILRKYIHHGETKNLKLEHDMFQIVFPTDNCRGLSIVVDNDELNTQEVSVEKIYKKYDESFSGSITCRSLTEHDVYHTFGFIRPHGNSVSFRNITRKKIDLQVLSYE